MAEQKVEIYTQEARKFLAMMDSHIEKGKLYNHPKDFVKTMAMQSTIGKDKCMVLVVTMVELARTYKKGRYQETWCKSVAKRCHVLRRFERE